MPTIVYLHGFNSAPQSVKGQILASAAAALPDPPRFHLPQLSHRPAQAMRDVRAWIDREAPAGRDLALIGSSLGGFYATFLAEKYGARAVLINPAIRPHEDLRPYVGRQRNLYTGEEYEVTPAHFDEPGGARGDANHAAGAVLLCSCAPATRSSIGARRSRSTPERFNTSPAEATTAGRISTARWRRCCGSRDAAPEKSEITQEHVHALWNVRFVDVADRSQGGLARS